MYKVRKGKYGNVETDEVGVGHTKLPIIGL